MFALEQSAQLLYRFVSSVVSDHVPRLKVPFLITDSVRRSQPGHSSILVQISNLSNEVIIVENDS